MPFDQSWLQPGYAATYEGTPLNGGDGPDPLRWARLTYAILEAGPTGNLTFYVQGLQAGQVRLFGVTYDPVTRREANGPHHATLWINDADVLAGRARLGGANAILTATTPTAYVFTAGTAHYHYDRQHGMLVAAHDHDTGARAALVLDVVQIEKKMRATLA